MGIAEDLERWTDAGLIERETATAIIAFETESGEGRVGRGTEAIAYLGSLLVLISLWILAVEYWDELQAWGRVSVSAAVTVALSTVGYLLGRSDEPAVNRAQAFAWFLTVAGVALTAAIVLRDIVNAADQDVFLYASILTLVCAFTLWRSRVSTLQMVALAGTAAVTASAIVSRFDGLPDWSYGVAIAGTGALWIAMTWADIFQPRRTSYALGSAGVLMISFPDFGELPWPFIGIGVGLALMALSVILKENVLLGMGVAGLFVYIPTTVFELFGDTFGVPVALLITGLVLLGVALTTAWLRWEPDGPRGLDSPAT